MQRKSFEHDAAHDNDRQHTAEPKRSDGKGSAKVKRPRGDLPPWLRACEKDDRDRIIPNLANLIIALRSDPDLANTRWRTWA